MPAWVRVCLVAAFGALTLLVGARTARAAELASVAPVEVRATTMAVDACTAALLEAEDLQGDDGRLVGALCDFRGATVIAPAPLLLDSQGSIDVTASSDADAADAAIQSDERAPRDGSQSFEPIFTLGLGGAAFVAHAVPCGLLAEGAVGAPRAGVRARVDRPPRG